MDKNNYPFSIINYQLGTYVIAKKNSKKMKQESLTIEVGKMEEFNTIPLKHFKRRIA